MMNNTKLYLLSRELNKITLLSSDIVPLNIATIRTEIDLLERSPWHCNPFSVYHLTTISGTPYQPNVLKNNFLFLVNKNLIK